VNTRRLNLLALVFDGLISGEMRTSLKFITDVEGKITVIFCHRHFQLLSISGQAALFADEFCAVIQNGMFPHLTSNHTVFIDPDAIKTYPLPWTDPDA
jgi:hypothetical protein